MVLEQLDFSHMQNNEIGSLPALHYVQKLTQNGSKT